MIPFRDVNRVEVIDGSGRAFTRYGVSGGVDVDLQDGGRTLKIFLSPEWRLDRAGGALPGNDEGPGPAKPRES
jgi:hypothetical protein